METTTVDFEKSANNIILALKNSSAGMTELEQIRYVYNHAIDDAAIFVHELGEANPQHAVAFRSLEAEMHHWLTLR